MKVHPGRVLSLALTLSAAVACGGRYERNPPSSDDAPSPTGTPMGGSTSSGEVADNACRDRYETYVDYRTMIIQEFASVGCSTATDCVAFVDQSDCDPSCVRVVTGARRGVSDRLNAFKLTACSDQCLTEPRPTCPTFSAARCVDGRCL